MDEEGILRLEYDVYKNAVLFVSNVLIANILMCLTLFQILGLSKNLLWFDMIPSSILIFGWFLHFLIRYHKIANKLRSFLAQKL
jgi:hypothetical protein